MFTTSREFVAQEATSFRPDKAKLGPRKIGRRAKLARVEASGEVEAKTEDLFNFTDWCYNDPVWAPSIKKA